MIKRYFTIYSYIINMEVIKNNVTIYISDYTNEKKEVIIDNFKLISIEGNTVYYQFKLNNETMYSQKSVTREQQYILYEAINNIPLWNLVYRLHHSDMNLYTFQYIITLNLLYIDNYIDTSLGLKMLIVNKYNELPIIENVNFNNKSFISIAPPITPNNFPIKLYDYQKRTLGKMMQIETRSITSTIQYTVNIDYNQNKSDILESKSEISIEPHTVIYNPLFKKIVDEHEYMTINTKGGILADEMGLGKTIVSIALIYNNPITNMQRFSNNLQSSKISSKATLILCPSHLTKQWESEILRCIPKCKIITILTKNNHINLKFNDFIESDVIIVSHQFIMNFKYYPTLNYRHCTASNFNFNERQNMVESFINSFKNIDYEELKNKDTPLFEYFNFHRIILDEGHEIFGGLLSTISLSSYMSKWISKIDSNYVWYVSGTPFINYHGLINSFNFLDLKLIDMNRNFTFSYNNNNRKNSILDTFSNNMKKEYILKNIIDKIFIRHYKSDIENEVKIPSYVEEIVWVDFTNLERNLYESKKSFYSETYLQRLCCHPLVLEVNNNMIGNEIDLSLIQDNLIINHKNNYEKYKVKLESLDVNNKAYHMLKKSYTTQMTESKYMFTILEKMKNPNTIIEEECIICIGNIIKPTLTTCGHLFCNECIKQWLSNKKICPLCKTDLTGKELLCLNTELNSNNSLIDKYGSKLGKLITMIQELLKLDESRIIIFSQWDVMINIISKTLVNNDIGNSIVKGNAMCRNSAIKKFKNGKKDNGDDNKVIILSLKNSASGTNLTEATHIFFIEPINESKEECNAIEKQAIARACRIGQSNQIKLIRILIRNSIEEIIYNKNYL